MAQNFFTVKDLFRQMSAVSLNLLACTLSFKKLIILNQMVSMITIITVYHLIQIHLMVIHDDKYM